MKFDDEICKGVSCPECSFNKREDGCLLAKRLDEIEIIPEPCEDAISRQAVKEQMIKYGFHAPDMTVTEFVKDLPPVTPTCEEREKESVHIMQDELISRQAVIDIVDSYSESQSNVEDVTQDIISDISALPPATPQQKTGHWIALEEWKRDFKEYVNSLSMLRDDYKGIMEYIDELPVNPQPKIIQEKQAESEKYDKAFDDGYENGYAQARFDYEQEPKTGHWIYKIYGGFHEQGDWYCSHCDYQFNYGNGHAKHCPECGYEMSEAPTEEVMSEYDRRRCNYPNDI